MYRWIFQVHEPLARISHRPRQTGRVCLFWNILVLGMVRFFAIFMFTNGRIVIIFNFQELFEFHDRRTKKPLCVSGAWSQSFSYFCLRNSRFTVTTWSHWSVNFVFTGTCRGPYTFPCRWWPLSTCWPTLRT